MDRTAGPRPIGAASIGALALLAVLAAAVAGCDSSSTGRLDGQVVGEGDSVRGTRLVLTPLDRQGEERSATTSAGGRFEFGNVKKGRYRLSVEYRIAGTFGCTLRYPAEVRAGKTVKRRIDVRLIDVAPNGRAATLPNGKKGSCATLQDPVKAFLCQGVRLPMKVFALPPRDIFSGRPYRRLGAISEGACSRLVVLGRLPGGHPLVDRPSGWLLVSVPGTSLRGWVFPRAGKLGPQVKAWKDAAVAKADRLPKREPTLRPAKGLPDLAFTRPRQSANPREGDPCDLAGPVVVTWIVSVRNDGGGLTPKRLPILIQQLYGASEHRRMGSGSWVRGLAPGEQELIGVPAEPVLGHEYQELGSYTHVTLDPDNEIKESNESNNEISLGKLPDNFICKARTG